MTRRITKKALGTLVFCAEAERSKYAVQAESYEDSETQLGQAIRDAAKRMVSDIDAAIREVEGL